MKCILHIGAEKTGSTSIQKYLSLNDENLRQQNILGPSILGKDQNRELVAAFSLRERLDDYAVRHQLTTREDVDSRIEEIIEVTRGVFNSIDPNTDAVIISSEHFHSRLKDPVAMRSLKTFLDEFFKEIEILVYVRRQDQMAVSLYSTAIKAGHIPKDFFPKIPLQKGIHDYYDFSELTERWATAFGRGSMRVRVFDRATFFNNDLLEDFSEAAGIKSEGFEWPKKENPSVTVEFLEFYKASNAMFGEFPTIKGAPKNLMRSLIKRYVERGRLNVLLPSREKAVDFFALFNETNNVLSEQWFDGNKIFSDDFSRYPDIESKALGISFQQKVLLKLIYTFLSIILFRQKFSYKISAYFNKKET